MIRNIPRRIVYGSEKFRLVCLHNCDIGFVGATPQFNSIGPYRFEYRFINSVLLSSDSGEFFFQ